MGSTTRSTSGARRVVIVGASAAGMRCASRLARLQPTWSVRVVEQSEVFAYAACGLPYAVSGDVPSVEHLRKTASGALRDEAFFATVKGVEVLSGRRAVELDVERRRLRVTGVAGDEWLGWHELVLATGARPRRLPGQPDHPRVRSFHVYEDVQPLYEGLARGEVERVVLVGAGLVGCELAEALREMWDAEVTLLEAAPGPLPGVLDPEMSAVVAAKLAEEGVVLRTNAPAERVEVDEERVRVTAGGEIHEADLVLVAVGLDPAVELARQVPGLALGPAGGIAVDDRLATSVPHVWAAGDCVEGRHAVTGELAHRPLGSLANRQGRTLAGVLAGRDLRFPPVVGAGAVKVFGYNVAFAGITRAQARERWGDDARSVSICSPDRADFWPEHALIFLHLVYHAGTGRLLGIQGVGEGDVAKRVDVAAQLIVRGATIDELAQVEHAYAPPYAPAVDPLHLAAFAAGNQEDGVEAAPAGALAEPRDVLDVRDPEEQEARPLEGQTPTSLPLGELRARVAELPAREWTVVCERGSRSAEALRILHAAGGTGRYVAGGLKWWKSTGG